MLKRLPSQIRQLIGSPELVASLILVCLVGLWFQVQSTQAKTSSRLDNTIAADINHDLDIMTPALNQFENDEVKNNLVLVTPEAIDIRSSQMRLDLAASNLKAARQAELALAKDLTGWQSQLTQLLAKREADKAAAAAMAAASAHTSGEVITAPILIYHYPPPNFETQLLALIHKGYTTIDPAQLAAAINSGASLPPKPVIITFDDGFANQMSAFDLLSKYHMKATFYIINGGAQSGWCIGAGRHFDQPQACGDAYLSWDQIRQLDHSGLITIGVHTLDHLDLARQPADIQRSEIFDSKASIEQELGHSVNTFAYPYGSFSGTTVALVRAAGFSSAVSTLPGTAHSGLTLFTLHRVRDAIVLP